MCYRLRHVPRLSAETQSHLSRWRMPDAPLPLRPGPFGWGYYLADPVHHVSRGVHRPAPLCLALSPDATGGGPQRLAGDAWWTEFGTLCDHLAYLTDGALPSRLCA